SAPAKAPNDMVTFGTQVVTPGSSSSGTSTATAADEAKALAELEAHKETRSTAVTGHLHTIAPLSQQQATPQAPPPAAQPAQNASAPVTPPSQAAILPLVSNNDLSVATIAREAKRTSDGEVVVKLH